MAVGIEPDMDQPCADRIPRTPDLHPDTDTEEVRTMRKQKDNRSAIVIAFADALAVLFIALKLTGCLGWSWLWVLSPIWIQLILAAIGFVVILKAAAEIYKDDWMM